ncbi:rrna processing protein nop9 [Moniliophthora roreri]|uniref:Nucleolar protein 9 n=1 Tax=Moniliophthora roreri TaxID=221103 RepID=A0A0W0G475_MONRR|nr:rrna processing protein nop9 [Moniliophthora roreri]
MPRENRKRGKRKTKNVEDVQAIPQEEEQYDTHEPQSEVGPSWIVSKPSQDQELNPEAPFGYVDSDVKAYFRTVDTQIRNWQDGEEEATGNEISSSDPNAEKQMFFVAALTEMTGKEKQLATDPDCSIVLERMAYSMDDFVRRVFLDSLSGSYEILMRHRFASHVCQTLFSVSAETISREVNGIYPSIPDSGNGELRTMSHLILDICEELLPSLNTLMMDPFASHVIRVLLSLLCPAAFSKSNFLLSMRSKRSSSWKSKQGNLTSLFSDNKGKGKEGTILRKTPSEFRIMSRRFVETLKEDIGGNEVRALAANDVASPCLTMLLHVEAELGMADVPDSLMDRVTVRIVSASINGEGVQPSDYLGTLFRDPTSSHLLETIMFRASEKPFSLLWSTYLKGKLPRLAIHPVANYVVAKSLERCNNTQLENAYQELDGSWEKLISSARTSVLRAAIDRSATLQSSEEDAINAIFRAFHLSTPEEKKYLVPCVLSLKTIENYRADGPSKADSQSQRKQKKGVKGNTNEHAFEASIQGSLLLQSALKLSESFSQPIVDSLVSLEIQDQLKIAYDSTGSRVMDAILDSPTLSAKVKRQFVMSFMGHFHELVDDRIGSRVGDRCFEFVDTYLKEKIARSVMPYEQNLIGSFYGKFFARNLNLYLLRRRPDEWRSTQSSKKQSSEEHQTPTAEPAQVESKPQDTPKPKKRKRDGAPKDEIDEVFASAPVKKMKGPGLAPKAKEGSKERVSSILESEGDLKEIFSAIRSAPKNDAKEKGRKKR